MHRLEVQVVKSFNPQLEAALILKGDGMYQVLWDTCKLIYGPASLVKDSAHPDEVAVLGLEGRIRTNFGMIQTFHVQHCFEFGHPQKGYYISLSLRAEPEGHPLTLRIEPSTEELDGGMWQFKFVVEDMTRFLEAYGLWNTMKWWLFES